MHIRLLVWLNRREPQKTSTFESNRVKWCGVHVLWKDPANHLVRSIVLRCTIVFHIGWALISTLENITFDTSNTAMLTVRTYRSELLAKVILWAHYPAIGIKVSILLFLWSMLMDLLIWLVTYKLFWSHHDSPLETGVLYWANVSQWHQSLLILYQLCLLYSWGTFLLLS